MLRFSCTMLPMGSCVWTLSPQLMDLFWGIREPLGGVCQLEEGGIGEERRSMDYSPVPLLLSLWRYSRWLHTPAPREKSCSHRHASSLWWTGPSCHSFVNGTQPWACLGRGNCTQGMVPITLTCGQSWKAFPWLSVDAGGLRVGCNAISGQVGLGSLRKVVMQARRSKPVSSPPWWSLLQAPALGFSWRPTVTWSQVNPFLPTDAQMSQQWKSKLGCHRNCVPRGTLPLLVTGCQVFGRKDAKPVYSDYIILFLFIIIIITI